MIHTVQKGCYTSIEWLKFIGILTCTFETEIHGVLFAKLEKADHVGKTIQNSTEKDKKCGVFYVWVNNTAYDCPVDNLHTKWDNEQFFEEIPLELSFIEPQELPLNLAILPLS